MTACTVSPFAVASTVSLRQPRAEQEQPIHSTFPCSFWKGLRKEICKSEDSSELALPFCDEWKLEVCHRVRRVAAGSERPDQGRGYL